VFGKLKTFLYTQVYINILVNIKKTTIYVEELHFDGKSQIFEKIFDTSENDKINGYISQMAKKTPLHYISLLDTSLEQGATPTCSSQDMTQFCDLGASKHVCYSKQWGYYTSKLDVLEYQKRYAKVGLDYIFSPFLLLNNFFKDKIDEDLSLFILVQNDFLSLCVFNHSALLFAKHLDMDNQNEFQDDLLMEEHSDDEDLSLDDVGINLEDVNVIDDIDSLDDFDDIEDLATFDEMDEVDEMDEFSEDDSQEVEDVTVTQPPLDEENGFGEDYHRFSLIQSAIKDFYLDEKFESDFVQKVYIANAVRMSNELKKFLEEEMYLSVIVRKINLGTELCEAAKAEKR